MAVKIVQAITNLSYYECQFSPKFFNLVLNLHATFQRSHSDLFLPKIADVTVCHLRRPTMTRPLKTVINFRRKSIEMTILEFHAKFKIKFVKLKSLRPNWHLNNIFRID